MERGAAKARRVQRGLRGAHDTQSRSGSETQHSSFRFVLWDVMLVAGGRGQRRSTVRVSIESCCCLLGLAHCERAVDVYIILFLNPRAQNPHTRHTTDVLHVDQEHRTGHACWSAL
eukprot:4084906-Prymnesium_polylepis.1